MKHFGKIISLLALAVILAGCHADKGLQTEFCKKDQTFAFMEGSQEGLAIKLDVEYVTGGLKKEVMEAVNQVVIGAAFGNKYEGLSVVEASEKYVEDSFRNYKESNDAFLADMDENASDELGMDEMNRAAFDWQMMLDASFLAPYEHYLTYLVETYSFEGGAHGMSYKIPVVLDSKTGAVVSEEDFFTSGYKEELGKRLTAHLHDAFENEEDYECLFTKDIEPNGNFYLTADGVVYVYGAYDIGPYYLGIIEVTVPWTELEGLLK